MSRALFPWPGLREPTPSVRARWRGHRIEAEKLATFLQMTGLSAAHGLPILAPHVFGFPLVMAVLTHPKYPLPIWSALQVRNRLIQHAAIAADAVLDFETATDHHRALLHPQLIIGQCLAHLQAPAAMPQRLDTWIKGPVPYDCPVRLYADQDSGGATFALFAEGESRPAILGRWRGGID
jgi:hypothetical protein